MLDQTGNAFCGGQNVRGEQGAIARKAILTEIRIFNGWVDFCLKAL
jgi:hypothetical protein